MKAENPWQSGIIIKTKWIDTELNQNETSAKKMDFTYTSEKYGNT